VDSGDADADTDTDADTDADTDTDTDVDSDSGDTGATSPRFSGPFRFDATSSSSVDVCAGNAEIVRSDDLLPGTFACVFSGPLAASYPSGISGTIEGTAAGAVAAGTLHFTASAFGDVAWSGALTSDTLEGRFTGAVTGLPDLEIAGTFALTQ
jgi:hypothetical protein